MSDDPAPTSAERRSWRSRWPFVYRQLLILLLVLLFGLSILLPRMLVFVEAGEAGVLFRRLGGGVDHDHPPIREGISLKLPWNDVTIYDLRLRSATEEHDLVTRDGLHIDTEVTFRYRPCYGSLSYLHQDIGPDYLTSLLVPQVGAMLRQVVGLCTAEEVYSTERVDIQNAVLQELRMTFSGTTTGGSFDHHTPSCLLPSAELPASSAAEPMAEPADTPPASVADEPPLGFRATLREHAHGELRSRLPPRYADIVVQADAIADDTAGAEALPPDADRQEVCGVGLRRMLETFRLRERNVPAFVHGVRGVAGDDLLLVQDVLIRSVVLPPGVREAIEGKVQQKQTMLGYRYRVSQELLESLRKEAEGLGVSAFQAATGPGGVNADYLRWQGIAATAGIAASPNAKIIVIGGKDGLPLILNTEAGASTALPGVPSGVSPVLPPAPSGAAPPLPAPPP